MPVKQGRRMARISRTSLMMGLCAYSGAGAIGMRRRRWRCGIDATAPPGPGPAYSSSSAPSTASATTSPSAHGHLQHGGISALERNRSGESDCRLRGWCNGGWRHRRCNRQRRHSRERGICRPHSPQFSGLRGQSRIRRRGRPRDSGFGRASRREERFRAPRCCLQRHALCGAHRHSGKLREHRPRGRLLA